MIFSFKNSILTVSGQDIDVVHPVREVMSDGKRLFVLLDPDSFISTPEIRSNGREPQPIRNLVAFDDHGAKLWEARPPEQSDYFYRLESSQPLVAYSFSSYRCELSPDTGRIIQAEFFK